MGCQTLELCPVRRIILNVTQESGFGHVKAPEFDMAQSRFFKMKKSHMGNPM